MENTSEEEAAAEDNEKVTAEGAMNKYVEHRTVDVQNSQHERKYTRDDKAAGEANNSSENDNLHFEFKRFLKT